MNYSKILLGILGVWALTTVALGFFDRQIYFPFHMGSAQEIPYHRWQTVRFTTFLTMSYFIFRYIVGFRPVSALGVLDMFFKLLAFIGAINFWIAGVLSDEWGVLLFFIIVALVTHRATKINRGTMFVKEW
jgi:hypothetical protein